LWDGRDEWRGGEQVAGCGEGAVSGDGRGLWDRVGAVVRVRRVERGGNRSWGHGERPRGSGGGLWEGVGRENNVGA
jgi:hypothetical protein